MRADIGHFFKYGFFILILALPLSAELPKQCALTHFRASHMMFY